MSHDVVIVGGGIIGLTTALRVLEARPRTRLLLIEKEPALARHQTGNNSGVIHAGLYYKPGSLKATTCRSGYQQLIDFCRREHIPHDICGKIVVATHQAELGPIEELHRRGIANGLSDITRLDADQIRGFEPHCEGIAGLYVPQTGIVDYVAIAERVGERVRERGGEIALGERVDSIRRSGSLIEVGTSATTRRGTILVACAGLHSDRLALQTLPDLPLRIIPFRGEYYVLKPEARRLVRNLIYPVPDPSFPFLGVHFTRMIDGNVECGPNAVFAFGREAYKKGAFSLRDTMEAIGWPGFRRIARKYWRTGLREYHRSFSKAAFVGALQRLVPAIREDDLLPGGAGIRAQACMRDGTLLDDFHILEDGNVVHVCNAPSPAATASFAIGDAIARMAVSKLR